MKMYKASSLRKKLTRNERGEKGEEEEEEEEEAIFQFQWRLAFVTTVLVLFSF